MLTGVDFYADSERGDYVEDPDHPEVLSLVNALNNTDNTFVVFYPGDESREWFISVATSRGPFGGYDIERSDPAIGEKNTTTSASAAPAQITTEVLTWINSR